MGFNAENGENRKFILCTNNEITKENPMPPKYALQFKQDLKNREKEDKKKNTNNHKNESSYIDGGEVRTSLNILIIHTRKIHDMV